MGKFDDIVQSRAEQICAHKLRCLKREVHKAISTFLDSPSEGYPKIKTVLQYLAKQDAKADLDLMGLIFMEIESDVTRGLLNKLDNMPEGEEDGNP